MTDLKITNVHNVECAINYYVYDQLRFLKEKRTEKVEKIREYVQSEFYMQFVEGMLSDVRVIDAQIDVLSSLTKNLKGNVEFVGIE